MKIAALAAAFLFAVALAYRGPARATWRNATALGWLVSISLLREATRLLRPDVGARLALYLAGQPLPPYEGVARASWAAEQALTLAWYSAVTWTVWEGLRADKERGADWRHLLCAVGALAFVAVELFVAYPAVRGRPIELLHVVAFFVSLGMQGFAFAGYALRWRRPDVPRFVALVLAASTVADGLGQWAQGQPVRDASVAGAAGVLVWTLIAGVELWAIAAARSER